MQPRPAEHTSAVNSAAIAATQPDSESCARMLPSNDDCGACTKIGKMRRLLLRFQLAWKPGELVRANALAGFERVPDRQLIVRLEQQLVRTAKTGFKATTTLFVQQGCVEENEIESEGFGDQDGASTCMNPPRVSAIAIESLLSSDPAMSSTETSISILVSEFWNLPSPQGAYRGGPPPGGASSLFALPRFPHKITPSLGTLYFVGPVGERRP
jgi:hypothetical protein